MRDWVEEDGKWAVITEKSSTYELQKLISFHLNSLDAFLKDLISSELISYEKIKLVLRKETLIRSHLVHQIGVMSYPISTVSFVHK